MNASDTPANAELVGRIRDWLALSDAASTRSAFSPSEMVASALSPLTDALGTETPVVSNAQLTGSLIEDAIQQSRRLKEMISRGDMAQGLEYFKTTPMDGCTSILDMARQRSGYNPMNPNAAKNINNFRNYVAIVLDAPVFVKKIIDIRPISWNCGSWNESVARVIPLFPGISAKDVKKIRDGLMALARAAAGHPGRSQMGTFFVQNIIQTNDCNVYLYYALANLNEIRRKKKRTVMVTHLQIARAQMRFVVDAWPDYAEDVWNRHVCAIVDWLDGNSTRMGDQPVELCFDT